MRPDSYSRFFKLSILTLLVVFFGIAHNLCWLNPDTTRPTVYFSIPYGWEYNADSGLELESAIDFPRGMIEQKARIARPLKNALISLPIDLLGVVVPLSDRAELGLSYVLHHLMNLLLLIAVATILFRLGRRLDADPGALFIFWTLLLFLLLQPMATSHTGLFQVASPAFICLGVYSFVVGRKESERGYYLSAAVVAILCGFTVLIKQQYGPYLGVLGFALYFRKWVLAVIWAVLFHLPFLSYRGILKMSVIEWYSHEASAYGQGIWVLSDLQQNGLAETVMNLLQVSLKSLATYPAYYGLLMLVLAAIGILKAREGKEHVFRIFMIFFVLGNLAQTIAANRPRSYMSGDAFIVLALAAALGLREIASRYPHKRRLLYVGLSAVLGLHILVSLIGQINRPWTHPHDQLLRSGPLEGGNGQSAEADTR